jgi:hypothetical protein
MLEISHELTRIFTKTSFPFFHRRGAEAAESDYFLFAFACIPSRRGLSKANEKKSSLCALCVSAVKSINIFLL